MALPSISIPMQVPRADVGRCQFPASGRPAAFDSALRSQGSNYTPAVRIVLHRRNLESTNCCKRVWKLLVSVSGMSAWPDAAFCAEEMDAPLGPVPVSLLAGGSRHASFTSFLPSTADGRRAPARQPDGAANSQYCAHTANSDGRRPNCSNTLGCRQSGTRPSWYHRGCPVRPMDFRLRISMESRIWFVALRVTCWASRRFPGGTGGLPDGGDIEASSGLLAAPSFALGPAAGVLDTRRPQRCWGVRR